MKFIFFQLLRNLRGFFSVQLSRQKSEEEEDIQ